MDFDYYQIKGKWNAATLNRRAEKLEEAQAAADELEEAGAKGVEIIGVKAGKRETIRGKKKAPATKKKAYTAPKMKVKAQEKPKPKKAAPKREPAGQLDLFTPLPKNNKSFTLLFEHEELKTLNDALRMFKGVFSNELWYKNLIECVTNAAYRGKSINMNLNMLEIEAMIKALQEFSKIYEDYEAIKLKNQLVKIAK